MCVLFHIFLCLYIIPSFKKALKNKEISNINQRNNKDISTVLELLTCLLHAVLSAGTFSIASCLTQII